MIYQSNILTTLAYLMGERTINATTSTSRSDFIQETLNEAYQAYPWRFATANATLTLTSGIATLPTNLDINHQLYVSYYQDDATELRLDEIDPADKLNVIDGSKTSWLTSQSDGTFLLNTKDTTPTSVVVRYQTKAPTLDAAGTVGTPYPQKMTLALGARRFVKLGQNPDADISQDEAIFQRRLAKDVAAQQVPQPRKMRRTRQSQTGTSTGDF